METYKFYPGSSGDSSVGINGWMSEVIINSDLDINKEDIAWFKEQIKIMFESWDCEGVKEESDLISGRENDN